MTNLFQHANSCWVKYSEYEIKKASDGTRYIKPASKAKPIICDPLEEAETLVIDALNVGLLAMNNSREKAFTAALMEFAHKYGLFGFITALPTTPHFLNYDAAYLPKNHFIKEEAMEALDYAALFFPFEKPDFRKTKDGIQWSVSGDNEMIALTSAFSDKPVAVNLSFGREYAERYDWLFTQFRDLSFSFLSSFLYYEDYDRLDESERDLYRLGIAAFGGIAPTYRIALLDKPTIVWDFHSLLLCVQMMLSFMLTNDANPIRICKQCLRAFIAGDTGARFCGVKREMLGDVEKDRKKKS